MDNKTITGAQASESNFLSRVYFWMAAGLGLSAAGSAWVLSQPEMMRALFTSSGLLIGLLIAEVALVFVISMAIQRLSAGVASLLFALYSFLNGVTMSSIFVVYTGESVWTTFAVTAGTFLFFSFYGMTTKKDLTSIGALAMMGLIGILLASLVNLFLKSTALMWITTYIGIAVFLGLIAYDTQKLKALHAMGFQDEESRKKASIIGALALYLDFVNLFLMLLRIFGRRRD